MYIHTRFRLEDERLGKKVGSLHCRGHCISERYGTARRLCLDFFNVAVRGVVVVAATFAGERYSSSRERVWRYHYLSMVDDVMQRVVKGRV